MEKKCGTCERYPLRNQNDHIRCSMCDNGSEWIQRVEEEKVELNLKNVTTVVQVCFVDQYKNRSKEYSFRTNLNLVEGDIVVVDTSTNGATVAEVCNTEGDGKKATRWVIQKVDLAEHRKRIVKEAKLLALMERMDTRKVQLEDFSVYANLAMHDQKMSELWAEYQRVSQQQEDSKCLIG